MKKSKIGKQGLWKGSWVGSLQLDSVSRVRETNMKEMRFHVHSPMLRLRLADRDTGMSKKPTENFVTFVLYR